MTKPGTTFAKRVLDWWDQHGRKDLPWQQDRTPYRVWISEIMLQQTQVGTVIPYFERFMERFPDLPSLAGANRDTVLGLWSGLGYYSRARNLHLAARQCVEQYKGALPASLEQLQTLPGIGRSTAAAIMAQAFDRPYAILDGNVKRLLARHAGIKGWTGQGAVSRKLWAESEQRLTSQRPADYTQAIMDLGAMVCVRGKPRCNQCPVSGDCHALAQNMTSELPTPRPKRVLPQKQTTMLLAVDERDRILLERRPETGVWAGLWCLPEVDDIEESLGRHGLEEQHKKVMQTVKHRFTHYALDIKPVLVKCRHNGRAIASADRQGWFNCEELRELGLPQPVRHLLENREAK